MSAHPANPASSLPFLFFLLLHLAVLSAEFSIGNTSIPQCKSLDCGDGVEIKYPFWYSGGSNSSYCGYPAFGVVCDQEGHPVLKLKDDSYRVANVDDGTRTITLQDIDLLDPDCPRPSYNLTLELEGGVSLAFVGVDMYLFFFFNCSGGRPVGVELPCLDSSDGRSSYVAADMGPFTNWGVVCDAFVVAPVLESLLRPRQNNLSLSLREILQGGFQLTWQQPEREDCNSCEKAGGKCGYYGSSSDVEEYEFQCFYPHGGSSNKIKKIIIGIIAGVSGFLLAGIILCFQICKNHSNLSSILGMKSRNSQHVEAFLEQYGSIVPRRYKFIDIKKMTKSFTEKLGQGGYGTVYKGKLQDGKLVAVKLLNKYNENGEEFINEVASIGRTHHINIVCLLGFCCEGSKRALIYEFMLNGSLEKFIFLRKPRDMTLIGWKKLFEIAIGIARGLEYLHRGCNARIVHFDIKPHNILLDEDFCPKISDFGLAKSCRPQQSILSTVGARGTIGYIAPEVFSRRFGVISSKSDVYSYGMMVLEMVAGRKNVDMGTSNSSETYFPHWIYEHFNEGGIIKFCDITGDTEEVVRKMILVGLWCIQTSPSSRPSISKVLEMLEGNFKDVQMPPKPYLSSP